MKSKVTAYLLLIFLGPFGAHKFYLGKTGMGVLYLLTCGLCGFGILYDFFTLGRQVDRFNLGPEPQYTPQSVRPAPESNHRVSTPKGVPQPTHSTETIENSRQKLGIPPGKVFHIKYKDAYGGVTVRDIEILKITKKGEDLCIHAFCHLRLEIRRFLANRIVTVSVDGQRIQNIEEYLNQDFTPPSTESLAALALED